MQVILHCTYEELQALRWGAESLLSGESDAGVASPAPSPDERRMVEELLPRLEGDLSVETLDEQRRIARAVELVVSELRELMEVRVVALHPADEGAVQSYFDFAHAFTVLERVRSMGREMEAILDVVGDDAPEDAAGSFVFPD